MRTSQTRNSIFLFAFALFCFAFPFRTVLYDNALSRLDLTYALALNGTTRIDEYHNNTLDKAFVNGHYYCDKAPGLSLAGVPVITALRLFLPLNALRPENKSVHYILVMLLIAIPSAAAVVLLYRLMLSLSCNPAASLMIAIAYAAGTSALHYSTLFMDHQFATNLVIFSFYLLAPGFKKAEIPARRILVSGLLLGWAAVSEYPSAVSVAVIACCYFLVTKKRWRTLWLVPGLVISAVALAAYNNISFGSPLTIGYQHEVLGFYREGMGPGIAGVTAPKPLALLSILFKPTRGLFWMSPFLLFCVFGFATTIGDAVARNTGVLCLLVAAARVLVVAGYYEPWGGFASGSRFLTGAMPFLTVPVALTWVRMRTFGKSLLASLCFFSVAQSLFMGAIEPRVSFVIAHPLNEYVIPLVRAGFEPASIMQKLFVGFSAEWLVVAILLTAFLVLFILRAGSESLKYAVVCIVSTAVLFACYYGVSSAVPSARQDYVHYYTGIALRQNGKFQAAGKQLREAVEVAEEPFPAAHFALGISLVRLERYEEAEKSFRLAIREGYPGPRAYVSLGALLIIMGRLDEAEKTLREGLSAYPSSPELNDLMNRLRRVNGD